MSPDAPQLQQKLSAFVSRARDVAPKCNSEATYQELPHRSLP